MTESLKTVHWLASKGHDWVPATIRDDNVVTMNGGGAGLLQRNFAILERAGAPFHYETAATELIMLTDPDWLHADSAAVGQVLAAAIRKIGNFDLVLCGRQASDTDGGQVLYWIAAALDVPAVSPITKIEAVEDRRPTVHRLIEDGFQRLRVELPALLGISSEINEPRLPSARGIMAAGRAMIPGWKASDLGLPALQKKVELRQLQMQLRTSSAEFIGGISGAAQGAALADKLHELGLI